MTDQSRLQLTDALLEKMLRQRAGSGAPLDLIPAIAAAVESTDQRAPGFIGSLSKVVTSRTPRGPRRTWLLVAAMLLVGAGVVGASLVGGRLVAPNPAPTTPAVVANPTVVPTAPSPAPSATPSAVRSASGLIVFKTATEGANGPLWAANADGTGKHELNPGSCEGMPAWSPDGTRLLISRIEDPHDALRYPCGFYRNLGDAGTRLYLTDASGSAPQLVDTGCVSPCVSDSRGVFSSDGRSILFVRWVDGPPVPGAPHIAGKPPAPTQVWVLATMDLETGRVTELAALPAGSGAPGWSPDRSQIIFGREEITIAPPSSANPPRSEILVADADGRNAHRVSPEGGESLSGSWSPDGTRILFQRNQYTWVGDVIAYSSLDIYTVRPDGTDLRPLTTDGISTNPAWSVDGRIFFNRAGSGTTTTRWIMDADGGNATQSSHAPEPLELADTARQPTP